MFSEAHTFNKGFYYLWDYLFPKLEMQLIDKQEDNNWYLKSIRVSVLKLPVMSNTYTGECLTYVQAKVYHSYIHIRGHLVDTKMSHTSTCKDQTLEWICKQISNTGKSECLPHIRTCEGASHRRSSRIPLYHSYIHVRGHLVNVPHVYHSYVHVRGHLINVPNVYHSYVHVRGHLVNVPNVYHSYVHVRGHLIDVPNVYHSYVYVRGNLEDVPNVYHSYVHVRGIL